MPDNLDRHEQVLHETPDDRQLLVVLLAEDGDARAGHAEELGDDRRDTFKMPRPERSAKRLRERSDTHPRLVAWRIHRVGLGREDRVGGLELGHVAGEVSRVAAKIFTRTELRRVDENTHHDKVRAPLGFVHEREMPVVKRAHRRDEAETTDLARTIAGLPKLAGGTKEDRGHGRAKGRPSCDEREGWLERVNLGTMRGVKLSSSPSAAAGRRRARASATALIAGYLLVGATATRTASAAPTPADIATARALFAQATADEQAGRWSDALLKIRRASAVKMTPGLRFHIALCEERTGHLVAALDDYTAAQAAARADGNREVLGLVSEPLLSLKVRLPTLAINMPARFQTADAQAEVRLDGAPVAAGAVGTHIPVDVGSHTIQATAAGQTPYAITVTVVERQAATVDVLFVPLGGSGAAGPLAGSPGAADTNTIAVRSPESSSAHGPRTLPIVATFAAVALVAGGVGAYVAAGSEQSLSQGECKGVVVAPGAPPCGNATAVRAWDGVALGAWIAGAGAGVAAVVLWARPTGTSLDSGHAELRAGPGTLSLVGTF